MTGLDGQPILTAAQMRAAEQRAIDGGVSVQDLMERAGAGVAEAAQRFGAGAPVLVLCGPGNNGGDGYVAARVLREQGVRVRVAVTSDPKSKAAIEARRRWDGPVEALGDAAQAPVVVDALFGTGLTRALDDEIGLPAWQLLSRARFKIAVDHPSALATDTGELLGTWTPADLTLALGALKPVHVLAAGTDLCGIVRIVDLGIELPADWDQRVIERPIIAMPGSGATKYTRGMVAVIGGAMPGASALAAEAALRAGAGYCLLLADKQQAGLPHAVVQRPWSTDALKDDRIGAIVVGPGLGRDAMARDRLAAALATDRTVIVDGDALHLLEGRWFHDRAATTILTPHKGEFTALFGEGTSNKIEAAREAAARSGAVLVFKGADTMVADTNGRVTVAPNGYDWLSTAGTGDVLAGTIGALASVKRSVFFSTDPRSVGKGDLAHVPAAVWLHGRAGMLAGAGLIADDLLHALPKAMRECLI